LLTIAIAAPETEYPEQQRPEYRRVLVLYRVEPISIEKAQTNVDANLKLVDDDKRDDKQTDKSPFGHGTCGEAGNLQVPSVSGREIRVGEAGNLTDDRDERDQVDEQSEDRHSDRKARGRRCFREAFRPPARLHRNIGEPSHDIFDSENCREDAQERGDQRWAEGGQRWSKRDSNSRSLA
jgi:hypothetical protein